MFDPVSSLMRIGLTEYEAKAYMAIATIGEGGVAEICQESGIPRSRTYDVMERLASKGFVEIDSTKPLTYRANDLKRVAHDIMVDLNKMIDEVVTYLASSKKRTTRSLTPVWLIQDRREMDVKVKEMLDLSSEYATIMAFSRSLLVRYAAEISKASDRLKTMVEVFQGPEEMIGLLGSSLILKPRHFEHSVKGRLPTILLPTRDGKKAFMLEFIMVSDRGVLIIYREEGTRLALSAEDSISESILRQEIKEAIEDSEPLVYDGAEFVVPQGAIARDLYDGDVAESESSIVYTQVSSASSGRWPRGNKTKERRRTN